jgi:hypothetical protein
MVEEDEPKTVIVGRKYYLKNRLVHRNDSHMKYAWYAYTQYIIMLALEEKIWLMTRANEDRMTNRSGMVSVLQERMQKHLRTKR